MLSKKLNLIFIVLTACFQLYAQQNNTLFLMHHLPQSNIVNPAVSIDCNLYVAFPLIGSTHANAYSTGFTVNDLLVDGENGELDISPDNAIKNFKKNELIATQAHISILNAGYRYKNNYFTFGVTEKVNTYTIINKNMTLLINGGNTQFEGQEVNMDGTSAKAYHYREYALGWARDINEKWEVGARLKMLFGKSNVYAKPMDFFLSTDDVTFNTLIDGAAEMYGSFPVDVNIDEEGRFDSFQTRDNLTRSDYMMNTKNKGFAADLGFIYHIDDKTTFSGSFLDLGYINWKSDAYRYSTNGTLDITGQTVSEGLANIDEVIDSLENSFNPETTQERYASPLSPSVYLGIARDLHERINMGAVFHSEFYQYKIHPSLTFSANLAVTKNIFYSASYTLQNNEFNNLGMGIGAKLGIIHLHAVTDNLPGLLNLTATRNANLRFGAGLLFGCGNKRKRSPKDNGIRALPCFGDPYHSVKRRRR